MNQLGVVGAGSMGAEIALMFAFAGAEVWLADRSEEVLSAALQRLQGLLAKGVTRGFYQADATAAALGRIRTCVELSALAECDLVTEAVFEDLEVKQQVLRSLDSVCKPSCILATNTSTIPISTLAACVSGPRRPQLIGTHYFSPVSRMKLVEIICAFDTSESTVNQTWELCMRAGKTPIRVKDVAGFAVNRVLHAFLIEAVRLVEEGVASVEDIDTACRLGLGHPMGPFELMDATTSSLCAQAQEIMFEAYGERFRPRPLLKQRVSAGLVGGKKAKGWRRP